MSRPGALLVACGLVTVVACKPARSEGETCEDTDECQRGLRCEAGRCVVSSALYQEMAQQSGVELRGERGAPRSSAGAVRVRSSTAKDFAFALCADDERLLGGWCEPPGTGGDDAKLTQQSAAGYTADDTIGARWRCELEGLQVQAFAMCQRVAGAVSDPPSP